MLTKELNELVTQTGPGTPGGNLMRRYWQPVLLAEELPPGGAPIPVRLLGEDLVAFRDEQGQPGLLRLHCSHRGADLSYGRLEDGGLRCIYHGWLYDIRGHCLEQPGEPAGSTFHEKIRHPAYPCIEQARTIFAYLGPGDPPLLPGFGFLTAGEGHVVATKLFSECNYVQGNEGNIDSVHLSFVHRRMSSVGPGHSEHRWFDDVETDEFACGIRVFWVRKFARMTYVHPNVFIMPNASAIGGGSNGNGYSVNWHVPIDDERHWKYTYIYRTDETLEASAVRGGRTPMTADFHPIPNKANRYLQDRALMADIVYSGIPIEYFQAHDLCVTEGQTILDRTREHLGTSDRPISAMRSMLVRTIKDLEESIEPPGVIRDSSANAFLLDLRSGTVPGDDWRSFYDGEHGL